jgi:gluconokinase
MHNGPKPPKVVVMGVSGSGKSLIGARLAERLGIPFFDADDFHSPANVQKMADGTPLTDADRAGWLEDLAALIRREPALVLGCSALKRRYRQRLREADPGLIFLYMEGDFTTIRERLNSRQGHYFQGETMLRNQFEQLEAPGPDEAVAIDIREDADSVLRQCLSALGQ